MSHHDDDPRHGLEATDVLPPARLLAGKYRLGRLLGEGGMGAVYEAEHTGLGTQVAVKLLNESFASDANALSRFRREARATAAISHDNIVAVYDTGTDEQGIPFIVMEQLEGESLSAYLRRERMLEPEVATAITLQILAGLGAAHEKTVIHRDLKPGNVILATKPDGAQVVKVLDFGISKYYSDPALPDVTATGAVIGTPRFMAPEQARGDRDIDGRVDIYAVGVLLYRMLCGKLPFSGHDQREIIERILEGNPTPLRQIVPEIPQELERVVMRSLAVERGERQQDTAQFADELQRAMPSVTAGKPIRIRVPTSTYSTITGRSQIGPSVPSLIAAPTAPTGAASSNVETRPEGAAAKRKAREERRKRGVVYTLLGLLVAALAAGGGYLAVRATERGGSASKGPSLLAGAAYGGKPIRFGVTRYLSEKRIASDHAPLIRYLADQLERPVKLVVLDGYVNIADRLAAGDLEIGALAAYIYVKSRRERPELQLLATHLTASGKSYDGVIIARAGSGIRDISELKGKVFCYVSHTSTSGYLYPRAEFRRRGLDPETLFKTAHFAGDHPRAMRMLLDGACDGAAVFSGMLYEAKKHKMTPEKFRILLQTPRIPYDAYCSHKRVPQAIRDAIAEALLALKPKSEVARKVLGDHARIKGFTTIKDSDYDAVRKIEHLLDADKKPNKRPERKGAQP
ncbi:MAG: hypothetical protein CSA24_00390 [Deltaproteobacteria bacterium]|nr:MAG: hypothetical protein CSB49_03010 [Pseudomonadota bacterium]PIE66354.1 MAG: hypothetical protein CSA24_00390 [Deltaproteobacteria bacterium]